MLSPEIQQETNLFFEKGCDDWILKLETTELPTYPIFQSAWDKPLCQHKLKKLLNDTQNDVEKARIFAVSSVGASAFLNSLPFVNFGLRLSNVEFQCPHT